MARLGSWIEPFPEGIYVAPGRRLDRSVAAQGRARWSPTAMPIMPAAATTQVWATPETLAIMECRYGPQPGEPVAYGEIVRLGEVDVSFVPAGHVLGSAQIVLEHAGERIVVSGDYKRRPDPTCAPFEPVPCDIFITEATFGLPVFRHPDTGRARSTGCSSALHDNPDRCMLVGAYALGKAQRLIVELRCRGHHDPIYIHGALQRLCDLYARARRRRSASSAPPPASTKDELKGRIVLAPPGALNDRWSRRLPDPITAMASGWMRVRQRARQRNRRAAADRLRPCRLGRAHRDHRASSRPREVWITHGREDALMHWCMTRQIKARELNLVGYEDEDD